jgi:hypothetical protein
LKVFQTRKNQASKNWREEKKKNLERVIRPSIKIIFVSEIMKRYKWRDKDREREKEKVRRKEREREK